MTISIRCTLCAAAFSLFFLPTIPAVADEAHATDPDHQGHQHDEALDELIVTFSGHERRRFDVIGGTTVLSEDALQQELAPTLGDTLGSATGVRSSGFAPGASRPIIRGLDGPRLRVLQNHVSVVDASTSSPDHQVASDPLLAQRIEVLKGAGTLRYGSNAVGGVVNVIDGRIAEVPLDAAYEGGLSFHGGSNQDDRNGAGVLRGQFGPVVLHLEGFARRAHALEVKGDPLSSTSGFGPGDPLFGTSGRVRNTFVESEGGTAGASWVHEDGFIGASYARLESRYGVPVPPEDPTGGDIAIDLEQDRFDFGAGWRVDLGPFEAVEMRAVYGEYEHAEIVDGEVGTVFENEGIEVRIEATQAQVDNLDGSVGLQWRSEERDAVGAEAFLPHFETDQWALFTVQELHLDPWTFEGGLRLEHTDLSVGGGLRDRSFTTWSASLGASLALDADTLVGLSLSRTERPPVGDELYADGPHFATASFEIGDDGLDPETAWSAELTAKRRQGAVTGAVNVYVTAFDDFLFQRDTAEIEDGLPVRRVSQADARFYGAEVDLAWSVCEHAWGEVAVDLGYDFVRASSRGRDLPRIPSQRLTVGAGLTAERHDFRFEAVFVDGQRRTARGESATRGYVVWNAEATFRPFDEPDLAVFVQARNLTDQRGRQHTSFLKDRLPIPGRDLRFGVRFRF